jgi:hypothetical protein
MFLGELVKYATDPDPNFQVFSGSGFFPLSQANYTTDAGFCAMHLASDHNSNFIL